MTLRLPQALNEALDALAQDPNLRVLVLASTGRSFCAGLDLKAMTGTASASFEANYQDALLLTKLLYRLNTMPVPTLALVQGAAIGLGVGFVAACDIVLASDIATFRFSEVRLGIIPAVISPYVIAAMGARACRGYFLSAESFDAAEAMRLGLVHAVAPPDAFAPKAAKLVTDLLAGKRAAQAAAKTLIEDIRLVPLSDALTQETARRLAEIRATQEARDAFAEFFNR